MNASSPFRGDLVPVAALLLISSLAFAHPMSLPAFEDEGSQLRWVARLIHLGDWRAPLGDGKPLEAWLVAPFVAWGAPALAAARALHVLAGMISAALTYRLARACGFGGRGLAFVSGLLFVLCPFAVYLERLALSDMFLCAAGLWALTGTLRLVDARLAGAPTRAPAVSLAAALVLCAFCKFPVGFVFMGAPPLALGLMPHGDRARMLQIRSTWAGTYAPVTLLAVFVTLWAAVRWYRGENPGFGLADFAGIALGRYPDIAATLGIPRASLWTELTAQLSAPVVVMAAVGIVGAVGFGDWRPRWLAAVGLIPLLGLAYLADFWYSRYLLFTLPPLIVSAAYGWRVFAERCARRLPNPVARYAPALPWAALLASAGSMAHQSALLVLAPAEARWSTLDRFQYVEGWPSGYGYPEAARFLVETPHPAPRIRTLDGHSAQQLLSYLPSDWSTRIAPVFEDEAGRPLHSAAARLAQLRTHPPVWILAPDLLLEDELALNFGRADGARLSLHPIARFDKPGSRCALTLYELAAP